MYWVLDMVVHSPLYGWWTERIRTGSEVLESWRWKHSLCSASHWSLSVSGSSPNGWIIVLLLPWLYSPVFQYLGAHISQQVECIPTPHLYFLSLHSEQSLQEAVCACTLTSGSKECHFNSKSSKRVLVQIQLPPAALNYFILSSSSATDMPHICWPVSPH